MDALLTDEQEALRSAAQSLARDIGAQAVSDLADRDPERGWKLLNRSGFLSLRLPERFGGAEASGVEVAVVTEQLATALACEPFVGCAVLAAELARLAGADGVMAAIGSGTRMVTVCLSADLTGLAPAGEAPSVAWDAAGCDSALALDGDDLVEIGLPGTTSPCIDLTRRVVNLAAAPQWTVVGHLDENARRQWTALALTAVTADLVGVMQGALSLAVRYAGEREQFGVPIGSFQAIAHLCAEQAVRVAAARSALNYAAWCADASPDDALDAARVAKAYASEAALAVTEAAVQVHGGIGMTWECLAHVYLRRALMTRAVLGDDSYQLYDSVFIPDSQRIGPEGQGWTVAMSTLAFERGPADIGVISKHRRTIAELHELAAKSELPDAAVRVARCRVQVEVLRLHVLASLSHRVRGQRPGPEGSLDKLLMSETDQLLAHTKMYLLGSAPLLGEAPDDLYDYFWSRAATIYGGTAQIQKTIVAERVLGLPVRARKKYGQQHPWRPLTSQDPRIKPGWAQPVGGPP